MVHYVLERLIEKSNNNFRFLSKALQIVFQGYVKTRSYVMFDKIVVLVRLYISVHICFYMHSYKCISYYIPYSGVSVNKDSTIHTYQGFFQGREGGAFAPPLKFF